MDFSWLKADWPLTPDEVMAVSPALPSRSSKSLGWPGVRVEDLPAIPAGEVELPALTHTLFVLEGAKSPGRAFVRCGEVRREATLSPGTVKLIPAGLSYRSHWKEMINCTFVMIEPGLMHKVAAEAFDLDPDRICPQPTFGEYWPPVAAVLAAMRDEVHAGDPGGRLCVESLANVLAVHLVRRLGGGQVIRGLTGTLRQPALGAVVDYIMDNLTADLVLADLAAVAGLSEYHFARVFKASTGRTPHQFVIERRVERAKDLIAGGHLSLAQVAIAVGFADQGHLARNFKRIVGVTPSRFG